MKRIGKYILVGMGLTFTLLVTVLFEESIRLRWWTEPETAQLDAMSEDQKASDMRYLLELTHQVSPAEVIWRASGLENPLDEPEAWIERARQTSSNREFADLVLQYLVHVGQGGHAFLAYDVTFNPVYSLETNIPRDAFAKMLLWGRETSRLAWYAHANLQIAYVGGVYRLEKEVSVDGVILPAGSLVEQIEGLPVDAYVLAQQYRAHLRYDPSLKKFYLYPLLIIDPGANRTGWQVTFRLPSGSEQTVNVQKIPGYISHRPDESSAANIRCLPLIEDTLYVKVNSFSYALAQEDAAVLQECFAQAKYQKVIFDVRGNQGGEIWSYMDNVIAPLIREPVTYQATAANRESFYAWHGWRFWLYQLENDNELTDERAHAEKVETIYDPLYSEQGWRMVRVTRRIEPSSQPFPFEGQVFVLTDNNTLSAGDSFAAAMQRMGLGKVVGTNTVGWGQAAQAKMLYALPYSGLLFYMDSELTFNVDGSLNNFVGVMPDVVLSPSSYPTPYPVSVDLETLLTDPWIQWVLTE